GGGGQKSKISEAFAEPSSREVDAQYAMVLSVMKSPVATGVLVTEIAPASPAGSCGLRAGDIIVKLNGKDTRSLSALREQVAELIAATLMKGGEERSGKAPLMIRRGDDAITINVPAEPLGVRAIEVQAGIAAPLNPPNSAPGSIKLAWKELRDLQNAGGGGGDLGRDVFFRNFETDGSWLGWQKRSAKPTTDDILTGTHEVYHVNMNEKDTKDATVDRSESITFTLHTGDYTTTPAFVLDSVEIVSQEGTATFRSSVIRAGNLFRRDLQIPSEKGGGRTMRSVQSPREGPLSTIVPSAIPLLAAALPQQKDAVIPLQLMSARDFIVRPGYVLATRGKQPLPTDDLAPPPPLPSESHDNPGEAWRVDLLHCGAVIESDWFSDDRRLLRVDSFGGTTLVSRRVANEREARSSAEENPFRNIHRHRPSPTTAPSSTNFTN
ncbi:MAG: PDZ domain-containing protein, partial [Phycisphaerales bacterium]|nr:PDZ domain-containing protein [Phycisphaerales bacterium]